jgi:tRNA pseudouridine-54 N-methylase
MTKKLEPKELMSDLMLYDAETDDVYILNETARLVYKLYEKGLDLYEIEREIQEAFQTDEHQDISSDIQKCIDDLLAKGLISRKR